MVGSLARLRDECRRAKERLSDETATAIVVDMPGLETTVRMTRMELDDLIAGPLAEFLAVLVDTLERNRVPLASISAVATVGGGARIPLITQRLSEHLRAKVVTTPHPQLTAAEGAALVAHRSQIVETATALAPAAPATATVAAAAFGSAAPRRPSAHWRGPRSSDDPDDALETQPHFEERLRREGRPIAGRSCISTTTSGKSRASRVGAFRFCCSGCRRRPSLIAAVVFGLTMFTRDTSTVPAGTSSSIAPSPAPAVAVSPPPAEQAPAARLQ